MDRRAYATQGLRFELAAATPTLLAAAELHLPPGCRPTRASSLRARFAVHRTGPCPCGASHEGWVVTRGRAVVDELPTPAAALRALRSVVKLWVATYAVRRVFLHAGVVGWGGRAVVLPGPSMAGKSTLVRALTRAGASYLSDDMAPLDASGRVHPYPVPIGQRALDTGGVVDVAQADLGLERLAAPVGEGPLEVALVLFSTYERDARWDPRPVAPGLAALELVRHCVAARLRPARCLDACVGIAEGATCWRSDRSSTDPVIGLVEELLGPPGPQLTRTR